MDFKINFSNTGHRYTQDEVDLVANVMNNADPLTQGLYRDHFEKKFSQYLGVPFCFTTNNATSALELAAQLCQFKEGDEVVCPSNTFTASLYPFLKKGASVSWADIDLTTHLVTADTIDKALTKKTKAIIVVHLFGYMADMPEIMNLAKKKKLIVIEDTAQALGTEIDGKKAGSFGDFGIFSFHSHKNITTLGEGGMLAVQNENWARIIPMLRHNGHTSFKFRQKEYWIPGMGDVDFPYLNGEMLWPNNYCLGEVECALGAKLLDRIDELNRQRNEWANELIDDLASYAEIVFHQVRTKRHNYHHLIAYFPSGIRDIFIKKMAYDRKIKCIVPYYPLNLSSLYQKAGFGEADLPNTTEFFFNMCSIPFHHWLKNEERQYIKESIIDVLDEIRKIKKNNDVSSI